MEKICYLIEGPICDPYHMNPDTRYDLLDTLIQVARKFAVKKIVTTRQKPPNPFTVLGGLVAVVPVCDGHRCPEDSTGGTQIVCLRDFLSVFRKEAFLLLLYHSSLTLP